MDPEIPSHIAMAHKFFIAVICGLVLFSVSLASWHGTWMAVLLVAVPATVAPILLIMNAPGMLFTRMVVAVAMMIFCALNIHRSHGMTELHFGIFVLLAMLVIYQDWRIIAGAAAAIAVHHLLFNYLQLAHYPLYCFEVPDLSMVFIHAVYVVVETVALCYLSFVLNKSLAESTSSRATLQESLGSMQELIEQAKLGIEGMTAASGEIAASSKAFADGAVNQASSLEQTSANLEQITATVRQSAEMAGEAKRLASSSEQDAEKAGLVVREAVHAMSEINTSSAKISEIISTINEIAFQTNLLAVNAAVEAARAGEEGRGFAVVASEVRSLAQRTGEASREIKSLIEDSLRKLQAGTQLVDRSGQALTDIVESAKQMGRMVAQIANASAEQTAGVDQVNSAMAQIDRVTQNNTAETAKLVETTQALSEQSGNLMVLVETFGGEREVA